MIAERAATTLSAGESGLESFGGGGLLRYSEIEHIVSVFCLT